MTAQLLVLIFGAAIALYILVGYPILLRSCGLSPAPAVAKDLSYSNHRDR